MKRFTSLVQELERATREQGKRAALEAYFREAPAADGEWAARLLAGEKIGKAVSSKSLREWCAAAAGVPGWMVEACYQTVGDLGETISLLVPDAEVSEPPALHEVAGGLRRGVDAEGVGRWWRGMDCGQRLVLHRIMTGTLRVGVLPGIGRGVQEPSLFDATSPPAGCDGKHVIDAVVTAAAPGKGGAAAGILTEYTLAVWDEAGALVPIAKVESTFDEEEVRRVDRVLRKHIAERFGPVRGVEPVVVFEVSFESVSPSKRHKSGLAVKCPAIVRWKKEAKAAEASTLAEVRKMMEGAR